MNGRKEMRIRRKNEKRGRKNRESLKEQRFKSWTYQKRVHQQIERALRSNIKGHSRKRRTTQRASR